MEFIISIILSGRKGEDPISRLKEWTESVPGASYTFQDNIHDQKILELVVVDVNGLVHKMSEVRDTIPDHIKESDDPALRRQYGRDRQKLVRKGFIKDFLDK